MTIALYARRKGWPVSGVTVRLRHSRIHADDCAECETAQGMLDRIESEITVEHALCGFTFGAVECETAQGMLDRIESEITVAGELTEQQRAKLLEIANKCPVHRTLTSEINIRTTLV